MVLVQFEHTHLASYLAGGFAVACLFTDSAQGLIERNRINRKWLLLYGILCIFAYLYARPFIRVGIGSAKRGYINFSTLYIAWLCSAVFYHLPSLDKLGLDVRADVSMLIVVFLSSLAALVLLACLHTAAVSLRLLPRRVYLAAAARGAAGGSHVGTGLKELWILLLLNSAIIAVACSTYHSFCGNGTLLLDGSTPVLKGALCAKWLHPILTSQYPRFASWMLYGEGSPDALEPAAVTEPPAVPTAPPPPPPPPSPSAAALTCVASVNAAAGAVAAGNVSCGGVGGIGGGGGLVSVDFPLDGRGATVVPAHEVLSPVLTMWVTLVALYIVNILVGQPWQWEDDPDASTSGTSSTPRVSGSSGHAASGRSSGASSAIGGRGRRRGAGGVSAPSMGASSTLAALAASLRRTSPMPRRMSGSDRSLTGGSGTGANGGGGNGGSGAGGRTRTLEVKRRISKVANAGSVARGAAASAALAAARRSLTSLTRLAATTGRLRRAASDYLHASHPYLPALLGKVRRGMAALEPHHLAAELAEATGVPPELARALTRGSSFNFLAEAAKAAAAAGVAAAGAAKAAAGVGTATGNGGGSGSPFAAHAVHRGVVRGSGGSRGAESERQAAEAGVGQLVVGGASVAGPEVPSAAGPPGLAEEAPQPDFLDMVPWYSGTSADLFKTLFDLMVSVKLFLGRFDMRTMQAATAASMGDSFNNHPSEGDGFTYEHLDERRQLWLDFIADTGDGGNPTYSVAAALAAPSLVVEVPDDMTPPPPPPPPTQLDPAGREGGSGSGGNSGSSGKAPVVKPGGTLTLPRADVLLIGGDLAYPNPSRETYQQRLFRPFEYALPPPPHYHAGRLVVHKPDLPPAWGVHEALVPGDLRGLSPRSSRRASSAALRRYRGPHAFAIPGNHDWIDGLETFTREIQHKGWLGGWLLPQEKSYFALRLPGGWWLFGFDLALVQDIDMQQYRYFANVVEQRLEPDDQVILVTHEPIWLLEWFWQRRHGANLRQLVRGHLRGRARLHLAGDLHFYMRHSWTPAAGGEGVTIPAEGSEAAGSAGGVGAGGGKPPLQQQQQQAGAAAVRPVSMPPRSGSGATTRASRRPATAPAPSAAPAAAPCGLPTAPEPAAAPSTCVYGMAVAHDPSSWVVEAECAGDQEGVRGVGADGNGAPAATTAATAAGAGHNSRYDDYWYPSADHAASGGGGGGGRYPKPPAAVQGPPITPPTRLTPPAVIRVGGGGGGISSGTAAPSPAVNGAGGLMGCGRPPSPSPCAGCRARQSWQRHPHDPDHLVVNGGGGAFLHPTHVFVGARFLAQEDPAADATAGLYSEVALPCTCGIYAPGAAVYGGAAGGRIGPREAAYPSQRGALVPNGSHGGLGLPPPAPSYYPRGALGAGPWVSGAAGGGSSGGGGGSSGGGGGGGGGSIRGYATVGPEGEYVCQACYPSPRTSLQLGRKNLHVFRLRNTRFDVIGGVFYFLLVVSVLPRCSRLAEVLETDSPVTALSLLFGAYLHTLGAILGDSYLSVAALVVMGSLTLLLARGGGVGAIKSPPHTSTTSTPTAAVAQPTTAPPTSSRTPASWGDRGPPPSSSSSSFSSPPSQLFPIPSASISTEPTAPVPPTPVSTPPTPAVPRPLFAARCGGFVVQLLFSGMHCLTHLSLAIVLLLLLELGVETCIKYERLGADGPHSLYRWYREYEQAHFPDPMGLRLSLERWTLGLYPKGLQLAMSLFDVPEMIAVTRTSICATGGSLEAVSRGQALSYYGGMLAYYWLLATPAVGFVFGLYLYLSVCWAHVHYDEAFSSLREASCKSFCRLHIGPQGDLTVYTLALDEMPTRWQEDARWRSPKGGGFPGAVAHEALYPSRWMPAWAPLNRVRQQNQQQALLQKHSPHHASQSAAASTAGVSVSGGSGGGGGAGADGIGSWGVHWRLVDCVIVPRRRL